MACDLDMSLWARIASEICHPTEYTGFNDVMGSWKIIAMPLPLTGISLFSLRPNSSVSLKRTEPVTRAFLGRRPMVAIAVTDLPDPDSPTMPRTSPGERSVVTPRTALTTPSFVGKSTVRFSIFRTGPGTSGPHPDLLRVECFAQAVADQEHRKDEHDKERSREREQPPLGGGGVLRIRN